MIKVGDKVKFKRRKGEKRPKYPFTITSIIEPIPPYITYTTVHGIVDEIEEIFGDYAKISWIVQGELEKEFVKVD